MTGAAFYNAIEIGYFHPEGRDYTGLYKYERFEAEAIANKPTISLSIISTNTTYGVTGRLNKKRLPLG